MDNLGARSDRLAPLQPIVMMAKATWDRPSPMHINTKATEVIS